MDSSVINHASSGVDIETLANSLRGELKSLHHFSDHCCIYRVREQLRQSNESAYTPRIVSIGPLHHGRSEFKAMEQYKRKCLQDFLQRAHEVSLEEFIKFIKENEAKIRNCYAETIELSSDDFVKMILVNAAFVIEVLLVYYFYNLNDNRSGDRLYNRPWLIIDVKIDIWLLENQLPFFILEDLFEQANVVIYSKDEKQVTMLKLTHNFAKYFWDFFQIVDNLGDSRVEHLVDLLRVCIVPSDLQWKSRPKTLTTPSALKLHQAGVKIKLLGSSKSLYDIRFDNGILEIPHIRLRRSMEVLLKNIFAFEQCHCSEDFINDYVIFMSYLVETPKDVELLVGKGVIEHRFKDNEAVSTLFHQFGERGNLDRDDFYFTSLVENLNNYCNNRWHKWRATLKRDYFNTPWASSSVFAAVILLVLTFIQTECYILNP